MFQCKVKLYLVEGQLFSGLTKNFVKKRFNRDKSHFSTE